MNFELGKRGQLWELWGVSHTGYELTARTSGGKPYPYNRIIMTDIEKQYLKLVELYKTDKDSAINRMIDIFQEVSESCEHEIYHSIMEWIGVTS